MSLAFALLLIPIAASPVLAIFDGPATQAMVGLLAAATLAAVGIAARGIDVNFAARVTRYARIVAAVPAIWMVIQLLPLPFGAHSIWANANEALDLRSWGHISIDLGATTGALAFYLSNIALIVASLFVTRDRRRAEPTLLVLAAIAVVTIIALLISKLTQAEAANDVLSAVGAVGIILSLTLVVQAEERQKSRREETPARQSQAVLIAGGVGLLISIAGVATSATLNVALVALFGVVVFGSVQAVRRAGLPNWAAGILLGTIAVAAAMIVLWRYDGTRAVSPLLQFATGAANDALVMAQRILSDATWRGTGAGTYGELAPIYQGFGNAGTRPPTTAAMIAIELGWPMAVFSFGAAIGLIVVLYRGALSRGRDSFYSAAATAVVAILVGQAFCDASLFNPCLAIISSVAIGLGLAQSASSG